ncbi:MAG TPA: galactose-1-epimerase [Opitutae bacterium]|nr:galactose-1-epimerase [Opitutaceae bacterium]HCR29670.1 galactose-1-epimerase [Opitutae bacterium]
MGLKTGTVTEKFAMKEFVLTNDNGIRMRISEYGGIVREIHVPDRQGVSEDIVLGFDSIEAYEHNPAYFGALIGRFGNRIAKGKFELDGVTSELATNDGSNHLHGGLKGFDRVLWDGESISGEDFQGIVLRYRSEDGDEGYPGALDISVTYRLTNGNQWIIDYLASSDRPTILNPTQHSYFNLSGKADSSILDHQIQINASHYTPVDANLIPTGKIAPLDGTPLDFRTPESIGARIDAQHTQLERGNGYDHNFVIKRDATEELASAAEVFEPNSGRLLEVITTSPGVQFYTGNFLDGSLEGKSGVAYGPRSGFCLETQLFPDSPNQVNFPSARLNPGEKFKSTTIYRFSAR